MREYEWIGYTTTAYIGVYEDGEPKWTERKYYRCPHCRAGNAVQSNYCPNCGRRLNKVKTAKEEV